jgi:RimJ/RimL family protein N-acetyltransferase
MMQAPLLHTNRLYLKPLSLEHVSDAYVNWLNDAEVIRYLESGGNYTREKLQDFLSSVEKNKILFWAIHLKSNNKHIGNIKIDPINLRHGFGEYGILMGERSEWGKGYAREASEIVIQYCFSPELNLRKVVLGVVRDNVAAYALYQNMGFITEGIYKEHGIYEGKKCDIIRMAVFNPNESHA